MNGAAWSGGTLRCGVGIWIGRFGYFLERILTKAVQSRSLASGTREELQAGPSQSPDVEDD